jgi:AraC family ethanolamine operon transcriptional activator
VQAPHPDIVEPHLPLLSAVALHTRETDEFAGALLGGSFEYLPMAGHRFVATLRTVRFGDLIVQMAEDGAHVARAAFDEGLSTLLLPLRYEGEPVTVNGLRSGRSDALLVPGAAEFVTTAPDRLSWAALTLPAAVLEELAAFAPPPVRAAAGVQVLSLPAGPMARLTATLAAAGRLAERPPAVLGAPGCAEALAGSLRELVALNLAPDIHIAPQRRASRDAMRVVRDAEAFLQANLMRPLYRDDLCAALGVSRRKLHDAFVSTVGMTPPTYLKTRRLVLVRRALRMARPGRSLVKSVALTHGFWHLGYFAQDYRELFGELPSETLERSGRYDVRDEFPPRRIA